MAEINVPTFSSTLRALQISGWSGTGKTLLIEQLRQLLPGSKAYLKWTHHEAPKDPETKDTGRIGLPHLLVGPDTVIVRAPHDQTQIYRVATLLFAEYDWLLIEGDKTGPLPKILLGSAQPHWPACLWVSPTRPPWAPPASHYPIDLPLTRDSAHALAVYITQHQLTLSFSPQRFFDDC